MRIVALVLGIAAALTPTIAAADTLSVADVGSFHVGGRAVSLSGLPTKDVVFTAGSAPIKVDPNGDFEVEQMYVQYVKLAQPKAKYPLLLWHGGGLTGVTWETKPDGKPGWQMFFLRAGHDVYVSDAVERGRASWARYPEIFTSEPCSAPRSRPGRTFASARSAATSSTPRNGSPCPVSSSRPTRSISSSSRACRAGRRPTRRSRPPTTSSCRRSARA